MNFEADLQRHHGSTFSFWVTCFGEVHWPCHEGTQEALWRGLYGEELRLPTNNHH